MPRRRARHHATRQIPNRMICLFALLAALWPPGVTRAADPELTLEPDRGPCGSRVIVRGRNFAPGQALQFSSVQVGVRGGVGSVAGVPAVPEDGGFAFELDTRRLGMFCGDGAPPPVADGARFRLFAEVATASGASGNRLAETLFTVDSSAAPPQPRPGFAPSLTLEPEGGLCTDRVVVRGSGFLPGETLTLVAVQTAPSGSGAVTIVAKATADAGAIAAEFVPEAVAVHGCGKCGIDGCGADPTGEQYRITAIGEPAPGGAAATVASATFTVSAPLPPLCFPETGYCIRGRFQGYWRSRGGLPLFGYPIGEEIVETLEDGNAYTVQYFERVRMQYDPRAEGSDYKTVLGQFGRRIRPADPPVEPVEGAAYVPQTGHNLRGRFLAYWENNGRVRQFGYPISEEFEEQLEDGRVYTVQYFEHARFEHHPEHAGTPYDVLLGQFGRQILAESGR